MDETLDIKFEIDDDGKAEWAINKIKDEKEEMDRLVKVCEMKISEYQQKIEQYEKDYVKHTEYLKSMLAQYFNTVDHKKTKTQETYKLPAGTLKLKQRQPEYKKDNHAVLKWLRDNDRLENIIVKESYDWSELKKTLIKTADGKLIDEFGQIVEGIEVIERAPTFDIDF